MLATTVPLSVLNGVDSADHERVLGRPKPAEPAPPHPHPLRRPGAGRRISLDGVGADPARPSDLRRRRDAEAAETILRRADFLPDDDRALLRAVYSEGMRIAEIASLRARRPACADGAGRAAVRSRESARTLRRRVRRLVARALSPEFVLVLRRSHAWAPLRRRIAHACVLEGLSMRRAAARTGASLHAVRQHMEAIRALTETDPGATARRALLTGGTDAKR